jgi:hypothetical protein
LTDPFSSSSAVVELDGTVTVRPLWGGKAQFEEIQADGPKGRWEGMNLFLYDPESHEWSQTFANDKMGTPGTPSIGTFTDGKIELYGQDTFNDKAILVRTIWSDITSDRHLYAESYSNDSGRTWHPSFMAELTRQDPKTATIAPAFPKVAGDDDPAHAFDWDVGAWKVTMDRLNSPLTGSTAWTHSTGSTINSPFWGGRGNIAEVTVDGPRDPLQLLALRLYSPTTHEWTTSFATSKVGVLNAPNGRPVIGRFVNGKGEFIDQEAYNSHTILIRFCIWPVDDNHAQSEQAFSRDGGKTWETNWVNHNTRVSGE